jgi:ketosteroid isomerase-like protein
MSFTAKEERRLSDLEAQVQGLADRQAILDCIYRYARGVDRDDIDLVASAYHDDAVDDHGFYVGSGRGLGEWVFVRHKESPASQHHITNHMAEIDGDTAHAETYFFSINRSPDDTASLATGRYVDRFERRNGEWRIAVRIVITESVLSANSDELAAFAQRAFAPFSRDRSDLSYRRPLQVSRRSVDEPHSPLARA